MSLATPVTDETPAEPVTIGGLPVRRMPGWLGARAAVDGLACLAVAVLILRTFLVEGYMISTGSMAPALYGYHKRVVCPICGEQFARGVAFDGSTALDDDEEELLGGGHLAVCPNCGQGGIELSEVPRNHGDQLLVLKNAYEFRAPRRWEVVVFRNPKHPTQAFVKRVVGMPGERIQIRDGDVYADGKICRKRLENQRAMRIPVFESMHRPGGEAAGRPRWITSPGWSRIEQEESRFSFEPGPAAKSGARELPSSWLTYRHLLCSGGSHVTTVAVSGLPLGFAIPASSGVPPVGFQADAENPAAGTLTAVGTVSGEWERRLRDLSADTNYQTAISTLVSRSRESPITDAYGYNGSIEAANPVRDLMVAFRLKLAAEGTFGCEMTDGRRRFLLLFAIPARRLALLDATTGAELRSAPLPAKLLGEAGALVEMSVMDRQVLVALDGVEPFAPWTYAEPSSNQAPMTGPVRLGAAGLKAEVTALTLYRDVFYTRGKERNGVAAPFTLDEGQFFVLGDNSPVSLDSRSWSEGALPARLLLGKPFVVHLPSRPGTLRIGERRLTVRIPDFARMRYIH